jgi:hypothetical protein
MWNAGYTRPFDSKWGDGIGNESKTGRAPLEALSVIFNKFSNQIAVISKLCRRSCP